MKIMQNNSSGRDGDSVDSKECPTHRLVGKQAFSIEEARFLLDEAVPYLCEVCTQFFRRLIREGSDDKKGHIHNSSSAHQRSV